MKLINYLKDKYISLILFITFSVFLTLTLIVSKVPKSLIIFILSILLLFMALNLLFDYLRKFSFYNNLLSNIKRLDKSYLVLETISHPEFYEGKLLCDALYDINKSYAENIKDYSIKLSEFKEYIELWIHEVKIPLQSLNLIVHNMKSPNSKKVLEELNRLDYYLESVLYYVRSENAEKDYLITKTSLKKVINNIALKNKNDLLNNHINLIVLNINYEVYTDSKWLEFIINQILNNSIKYHRHIKDSYIKISSEQTKDKTILTIKDNGIGIPSSDIPRVFTKSFTGQNGHQNSKSTGMGLFIVNKLCTKLGHQISISSVVNEYTEVKIEFSNNEFYDVLDK